MLCTNKATGEPAFGSAAFRSNENQYRGRFRRIVTLGSPQNGSLILYYELALKAESANLLVDRWLIPAALDPFTQSKFDPFVHPDVDPLGGEVAIINSRRDLVVDSAAKFHLIRTNIDGGVTSQPGVNDPLHCNLAYYLLHLCDLFNDDRLKAVLPFGSDGIVDSQSAIAGSISNGGETGYVYDDANGETYLDARVLHMNMNATLSLLLFGIFPNHSQASYVPLAAHVRDLLDGDFGGPSTPFASFVPPSLVPLTLKTQIDRAVPKVVVGTGQISSTGGAGVRAETLRGTSSQAASTSDTFSFQLAPNAADGTPANVQWFAEAYGPNGARIEGLTLQVDTNDSTKVSLTVDSTVAGDVVLHASYINSSGDVVVERPIVAVSRPVGATLESIELSPSNITTTQGVSRTIDIWGVYDNGQKSLLYIPDVSAVQFSSSNTAIASFDSDNRLSALAPGSATLSCTYLGLSAQALITVIAAVPPPTPSAAKPDFNGDGKTDILWQNTVTGARVIWLMNGASYSSGVSLGVVPTQWEMRNH